MKRKLFAIIALLLFSFQIIPVKEIGEMLCKGLIAEEEVSHSSSGASESQIPLKIKYEPDAEYWQLLQNFSRLLHLTHKVHIAIIEAEKLPSHFVADVVTPPPNELA